MPEAQMSHNSPRGVTVPVEFARRLSAIVTDMDGTFFATGLNVLDTTRAAYERAQKSRLPIIPATGRCLSGVADALRAAGATDVSLFPGIYLNGCTTFGPGGEDDIICEHCLEVDTLQKMVLFERQINEERMSIPNWDSDPLVRDALPEHGFRAVTDFGLKKSFIALGAYTNGGLVFQEKNQLSHGVEQFREGHIEYVGPIDEYAKKHVIGKLLLVSHSGAIIDSLRPDIIRLVGDQVGLSAAVPRILELTPKGASKGLALAALARSLQLPLSCIASIGDGENDIDLLEEAGFSIAMGNGCEAVKSIATVITEGNNDGGWGLAVNSLLDARDKAQVDLATERTGVPTPVSSTQSPAGSD